MLRRWVMPLHSNMFLLIRQCPFQPGSTVLFFTFQYVSINTGKEIEKNELKYTLHSNMFLLIPAPLNHQLILPYYTIFCRP